VYTEREREREREHRSVLDIHRYVATFTGLVRVFIGVGGCVTKLVMVDAEEEEEEEEERSFESQ
jgi:hypothetical protein